MRPIKILILAALAGQTAMAFAGTPSAMAESTALCTEDVSGQCPEAKRIAHVHGVTLPGNKALLLGAVKIECDALFLGDVTSANSLGAPLVILGHFTYTNCVTGFTKCETKEVSAHAIVEVLKLGHELSDVTGSGEVNLHCGIFINCTYNGQGLEGHGLGPLLSSETNGEIRVEEQVTHIVKGFCPETAKLDILTTPFLSKAEIELAEAMGETFRSGPTYITN